MTDQDGGGGAFRFADMGDMAAMPCADSRHTCTHRSTPPTEVSIRVVKIQTKSIEESNSAGVFFR